jgi:hypothetical protein
MASPHERGLGLDADGALDRERTVCVQPTHGVCHHPRCSIILVRLRRSLCHIAPPPQRLVSTSG